MILSPDLKWELKQLQLCNFLYQKENYCQCSNFFINVITDKQTWDTKTSSPLLTTPFQTSYFIGPYNLHHLLFSGIGALLCHHPYCFQANHKPCLESVQVDLFTYLINIVLFVRIISRFIKLFGFVIHFIQGWYRNIMSLALKKFFVNVLVSGKNLREYSRTLVTRTLRGNEKRFELAGNSSYRGTFQWNCDQGKGNLVRVRGEFDLSNFQLSRFYSN